MRKHAIIAIIFIVSGIFLIGCAAQKPQTMFTPYDFGPGLNSGQYLQRVDNFLIVLDASGSMKDIYKGKAKIAVAKDIIGRMNQTMAPLELNGGLRIFGHTANPFAKSTRIIYGLTGYSADGVEAALQTVKWAGGDSPLSGALEAAVEDLKSTQGEIAVIVVSDGKEMDYSPLVSANTLKKHFGDRLCIYTVQVGTDAAGKTLLNQIAKAGRCGFSVNADEIASSDAMAGFVKKVFFGEKMVLDSDGDGVTDDLDQCPNTPQIAKVDPTGCPLDTDRDGVFDYLDQCPGTPYGVVVDKVGCPLDTDRDGVYDNDDMCADTPYGAKVNAKGCWVLEGILFDTGKWNIKPQMFPILDEVIVVLKNHPALTIEIQGHTDSRGDAKYNKKLSENRAKAVMGYFIKKGVDENRLSAEGFGEDQPMASNDTPEGRAMNRRVQLNPIY